MKDQGNKMAGFGNLIQKAVYLGVGLASYTTEKAAGTFAELKTQTYKLADELVQRGEMTTEEARQMVDEILSQANPSSVSSGTKSPNASGTDAPRTIEISTEDDEPSNHNPSNASSSNVNSSNASSFQNKGKGDIDNLRQQVSSLQAELQRLNQEK
jgi:polyhydroxyalkanoate synthesis regulator phasin